MSTPPLYALAKATIGRAITLGWRPTVMGLDHLPSTGAILAGNHLSVADEYFLAAVVPRHIAFWAKAEYFARGGISRAIVNGVGAISVERGGGRAVLTAFAAAVPVLRRGGLVAVYPEGTRSPDGRLHRGRTGAVRLAQQAGVPIVPVGVLGTDRVQPIGARVPRPARVSITFGEPMPAGGDIRAGTDALMARIRALTGQEYVPRYAARPQRL